jgi:hypothetical protein
MILTADGADGRGWTETETAIFYHGWHGWTRMTEKGAKQHPPLSVKIRVIRGRWIEAVLFAHIGVHPR